jgi:gluconate kinase
MERGEPLTDADRMPWLQSIAAYMDERPRSRWVALIACSAPKRRYREFLLAGRPDARIAFLWIGRDVAARWLASKMATSSTLPCSTASSQTWKCLVLTKPA